MNRPPEEYNSVAPEALRRFVGDAFRRAGMPDAHAAVLADLLVTNDLRGVFSHGTRQTPRYVGHFQAGRLTPAAEVTTVSETPCALVLDGGGGLGYFPCLQAAERLVPKARAQGVAVAATRNHGHFGAAGIYARIPVAHDLFCFVTSGHQLDLKPGDFVMKAAGGSPMAFGIPTGEEPPFVLDFGAAHDLHIGPEEMQRVIEMAPSTVLRSFGLGCACQALGGLLCGVPLDPARRADRPWSGADQGSFMIAVDVGALFPLEQFNAEMDAYARTVRQMLPLPGMGAACLPGTVEWERERRFQEEGVPVGARHAETLRKLAQELDLEAPV